MKNKINPIIKNIQRKSAPILKRNKIIKAGIFGSYARGEQGKNSDIDMLIKVKKGEKFSLFDLVGLERELRTALKTKIDLLTYNSVHPLLKERIMKEEIRII